MNSLKIITAFHGTVLHSNAFDDTDLYVPVYGGRDVSRYLPDKSREMLADNIGDNISWMNPYIGPFTCVYWASKNLDKFGYPEYIGLNHYRRLFPVRNCYRTLTNTNVPFILTSMRKTDVPIFPLVEVEYGIGKELATLFHVILKTDQEKQIYSKFLQQTSYPEKGLFIMPTVDLNGYVEFMMRAVKCLYLDFMFQNFDGMQYKKRLMRMLEFVTAYYLYKLSLSNHKHYTMKYEYPWKGIY